MDVAALDAASAEPLYDAARERAMARRLRGARWRRLVLFFSAVVVAGAAAGGFTIANRDMLQAAVPPASEEPAVAETPVAPAAPSLASATSRPVTLPGADSDPNKVQARVAVPADPDQPGAGAPVQMQDSQSPAGQPRSIPLGGGSRLVATTTEPPPAAVLPPSALGFAPLPAPRPSSAP